MSLSAENNSTLAAQVAALREEVRLLRAAADADEQQARFRAVFENSPFGQKIISPDLTIRQVNRAALALLDCTEEELVGHKIQEFAHPAHRDDWAFLQERLWAHKLPSFSLETCLVRRDGSSFWCQVTSIRFPDGTGEMGYTQLENISKRKALELALKRLYDAQETILHLVSHDLKTPIAHIQLLTDLLERQTEVATMPTAEDAVETARYLALVRRCCADAYKLLQDVLFLGSLEATQLKKRPTDLGAFLETRLQIHQLVAQAKGVALTLDRPEQVVKANLNADGFGRAVDNLVSNALKFTPAGGRVALKMQETASGVLLTVCDTGIGIPPALHAKLFDKFSASSRTGVGGETSTGLGLFITKQIVERHRGRVWVESAEGAGACFFVELS